MKKPIVAICSVSLLFVVGVFEAFSYAPSQTALTIIRVDDFGADRSAVTNAFAELLKQSTPATLVFGANKTYHLRRADPTSTNFETIFNMYGKNDLSIDGQGSTLVLDLYDSAFLLTNNKKIAIKNLKIAYSSTNFTQGTIASINALKYFEITVDPGYPIPNPTSATYANSGVFDNTGNFLRDSEIFIQKTELRADTLRIYPTADTAGELAKLKIGNKIAFGIIQKKGRVFDIQHNDTISLTNIEIYGSMGGSILASENKGELLFDSIQIKRQPKTDRLIVTLADGFHIFANRGHVTISNCFIERILDDGINIGSMSEVTPRIDSDSELDLRSTSLGNSSPELNVGDTISAYNLGQSGSKYFLGSAKILRVTPVDTRIRHVVLDQPIAGLVALSSDDNSGGQNLTDGLATRFFIDEISNPGFTVVNNRIIDKQRNGILARGPHGLVRRNTIQNVGGSGIYATNTLKFNEGPAPIDLEISGNEIRGIGDNGVVIGFNGNASLQGKTVPSQSMVVNNVFSDLDTYSIKIVNASALNVSGNSLPTPTNTSYKNVAGLNDEFVSSLFKIDGEPAIYFSSELGYCKYKSISRVTSIWGVDYVKNLSTLKSIPKSLQFTGDCGQNEGVVFIEPNSIQRMSRDGSACKYSSMENLLMLSGLREGTYLKHLSSLPTGTTNSSQACR